MDSKNHKNPATENSAAAVSQADYLRGLAEIVRAENLSELEIEQGGLRVTLKSPEIAAPIVAQAAPGVLQAQHSAVPLAASTPVAVASPTLAPDETLLEIVSPMVGVFYRAPSPADPNFIEIGDRIEVGQTVALVEAMKVFNEITAEVAGTVVEIKAQSADLVETGQVLITIRP